MSLNFGLISSLFTSSISIGLLKLAFPLIEKALASGSTSLAADVLVALPASVSAAERAGLAEMLAGAEHFAEAFAARQAGLPAPGSLSAPAPAAGP